MPKNNYWRSMKNEKDFDSRGSTGTKGWDAA